MERRTNDRISLRLVAVIAGLMLPLNAATFTYALSIEHRLTRIETSILKASDGAPAQPQPQEARTDG